MGAGRLAGHARCRGLWHDTNAFGMGRGLWVVVILLLLTMKPRASVHELRGITLLEDWRAAWFHTNFALDLPAGTSLLQQTCTHSALPFLTPGQPSQLELVGVDHHTNRLLSAGFTWPPGCAHANGPMSRGSMQTRSKTHALRGAAWPAAATQWLAAVPCGPPVDVKLLCAMPPSLATQRF